MKEVTSILNKLPMFALKKMTRDRESLRFKIEDGRITGFSNEYDENEKRNYPHTDR